MHIRLMQVELYFSEAQSLKQKRTYLRRIESQLRKSENIAISETGHNDKIKSAQLSIITIASAAAAADSVIENVRNFFQSQNYILTGERVEAL
ncbi:MAG TPA: DUF503 family protein [Candidatus Marinimicrobia bacterium]|nr:DUF503 family protein [Candidatus Neomarinimicrobiota bacterium]